MSVAGTVGYNGFPVPIGSIIPFITEASFPSENDGWIVCGGQTLAVEEYPDLYDVIGNNYDPVPSAEGFFTVPDLTVGGESFITGSRFTNGERQSASLVAGSTEPKLLTVANIPTLNIKQDFLDKEYVNITDTQIIIYASLPTTNAQNNITVTDYPSTGGNSNYGDAVIETPTLTYTNDIPDPLPDTQFSTNDPFHSSFVSVVYFIKARYFSPPVIPPYTQTIPPNSGIYNETDSLSGFLGPFPTYPTGF